jgi:hypothetical protein
MGYHGFRVWQQLGPMVSKFDKVPSDMSLRWALAAVAGCQPPAELPHSQGLL